LISLACGEGTWLIILLISTRPPLPFQAGEQKGPLLLQGEHPSPSHLCVLHGREDTSDLRYSGGMVLLLPPLLVSPSCSSRFQF